MKKFDRELADIQQRLVAMGDLAQSMVGLATIALKDRTKDVQAEVAASESQLDQMQVKIDHDAIRLLTVYGPVATDLRYILVVTRITSQLERIGDQVVNIFESLQLMGTPPDHATLSKLQEMAELVGQMVQDALDAYFSKDPAKAETTRTHDDAIDALNAQIVKELLSDEVLHKVLSGTQDIKDALAQILIARHLERIADQANNICKEVIYMVKGADVRHRSKRSASG
jgi:phosphate transport system protein